jgi:hypothetical protein
MLHAAVMVYYPPILMLTLLAAPPHTKESRKRYEKDMERIEMERTEMEMARTQRNENNLVTSEHMQT